MLLLQQSCMVKLPSVALIPKIEAPIEFLLLKNYTLQIFIKAYLAQSVAVCYRTVTTPVALCQL